MSKAFDVSANIGFDGSTYFCKRCGKAGYGKATQVRGHLALCPGTILRKGGELTSSSNHLQPLVSGSDGGLSGGQLVQPLVAVDPVPNPVDGRYEELAGRVALVENHYVHLMNQANPSQQHQSAEQDFFSRNKGIILISVAIFLALILSGRSGNCQGASDGKSTSVGNIGTKALAKLVDTGISKGVASLFK